MYFVYFRNALYCSFIHWDAGSRTGYFDNIILLIIFSLVISTISCDLIFRLSSFMWKCYHIKLKWIFSVTFQCSDVLETFSRLALPPVNRQNEELRTFEVDPYSHLIRELEYFLLLKELTTRSVINLSWIKVKHSTHSYVEKIIF